MLSPLNLHLHCLQLPLSPDLPGPRPLALPLSGPRIPLPGQQGSEARVIRISINNDHGNLYRSILVRCWAWNLLGAALPLGLILPNLPPSLPSSLVRTRPPAWCSEPWKSTMWPSPGPVTTSSFKSFLGTGVSRDNLDPGLRERWEGSKLTEVVLAQSSSQRKQGQGKRQKNICAFIM